MSYLEEPRFYDAYERDNERWAEFIDHKAEQARDRQIRMEDRHEPRKREERKAA